MGGRDATGQALGFGDEPERPLGDQHAQRGEARRIAANAVKLPDLLLGTEAGLAPDRIKLRTPILLRSQYDSAAAGQWQTTGA